VLAAGFFNKSVLDVVLVFDAANGRILSESFCWIFADSAGVMTGVMLFDGAVEALISFENSTEAEVVEDGCGKRGR
jgi:hypothetical protein